MQETPVWFLGREDLLERDRLPTPVFLGFSCGSAGEESACNAGDLGLIPELGRSPGKGNGYPLQYSGLENSMVCLVHGVTKSQTWLSNFHFTTLRAQKNSLTALFPLFPSPSLGGLKVLVIPTFYCHHQSVAQRGPSTDTWLLKGTSPWVPSSLCTSEPGLSTQLENNDDET